jgi:hypothetical protein
MNGKSSSHISRREFARRAALVSAASMVPATALPGHSLIAAPAVGQSPDTSLSSESQSEAEARYQAILGVYGSRFSDEKKADLRRLCFAAQPSLDRLRAYPLENGDSPALYLKPLVEREKKTQPGTIPQAADSAAKKP